MLLRLLGDDVIGQEGRKVTEVSVGAGAHRKAEEVPERTEVVADSSRGPDHPLIHLILVSLDLGVVVPVGLKHLRKKETGVE